MEPDKNNSTTQEDTIDIIALIKQIWVAKKFLLKFTGVFVILGIIIALLTANTYTASTVFIPNSSSDVKAEGGLKGLAALAGVNIGGSSSSNELSPQLYSKIMESASFKKKLLALRVIDQKDSLSFKDYLLTQQAGIGSSIKKYTIGLPGLLIKSLKSNPDKESNTNSLSVEVISKEDYELFKDLDEIISLDINDKEGFIQLNTKLGNPIVAAQITKKVELLLQDKIIALKTSQSQETFKFIQNQYKEKKQLLETAQNRLANFKDRNLSISSFNFSTQQTRLEADLQVATSVFQTINTQLEEVKLQLVKDTPVFSVLKPVVVPNEKTGPKRSLIVIIWGFLGAFLAITFILLKKPLQDIFKEITKKPETV